MRNPNQMQKKDWKKYCKLSKLWWKIGKIWFWSAILDWSTIFDWYGNIWPQVLLLIKKTPKFQKLVEQKLLVETMSNFQVEYFLMNSKKNIFPAFAPEEDLRKPYKT
jgi:hypothetical protein